MTVKSMTPWKTFQRQIISPGKAACEGNVQGYLSTPQPAWGRVLGRASLRPCIPLLPLSLGRPESFQICHLRGLLVLSCPVDTQMPEETVMLSPDPRGHWVSSGMVTTLANQEEEQRSQEDQGVTGGTTLPRIHLLSHT